MIVIIARFEFPPQARERMLELAREMDEESNKENGCLHYRHAADVSEENRLILSEIWADADALAAHFRSPHFRKFFAAASELGVAPNLQQFDASEIAATDERYWGTLLRAAQTG